MPHSLFQRKTAGLLAHAHPDHVSPLADLPGHTLHNTIRVQDGRQPTLMPARVRSAILRVTVRELSSGTLNISLYSKFTVLSSLYTSSYLTLLQGHQDGGSNR
jgi:hypothetical protein